ncbi:hypothetical protein GCM10007036_07730 [Alsobacter metallidurans]|uniref:Glycosyltransferase subfamily 4-like N-terminal domain-containing protein n=2 Tax=Alsobacter metallidurans TaxID=340221 RepID=A0A917I3N3_9HYPH|nr:hypothetical protein GCM10007036_07730 [Alsobacter metallidurans]
MYQAVRAQRDRTGARRGSPAGVQPPDRMLRVCLLTDSADPSGVGEHMLALAERLGRHCRVSVASRETPGGDAILSRAAAMGCRVLALRWRDEPQAMPELVRFLRAERIEVFHCHAGIGWEGLPAPFAAREAGVPVVLRTEHLPYLLTDPIQQARHAEMLPQIDRLICVSQSSSESFGHAGVPVRLLHVIPNGVAPPRPRRSREDTRQRLDLDPESPVLLTVGRFTPQKGHAALLAAAPAILSERPDARFLWVGAGPLVDDLRGEIDRRGLSDAILLLGRRDDVPDLMAGADLLVSPSLFEGHPLVVLEAMAAGLPIVATDVPGTRDAVDRATALLVPPDDPPGLARAALAALGDRRGAETRARAARDHWAERFDADRMAEDHLALYWATLAAQRPPASALPTQAVTQE